MVMLKVSEGNLKEMRTCKNPTSLQRSIIGASLSEVLIADSNTLGRTYAESVSSPRARFSNERATMNAANAGAKVISVMR